jgi:sulfate adenylyltransferase
VRSGRFGQHNGPLAGGPAPDYVVAKRSQAAARCVRLWRVTAPQQLAAPTAQLSDRAVADLQLVLDGVPLPWTVLGGSAGRPGPDRISGVGVDGLTADVYEAAIAAGEVVLADREQTPIARLVDVVADGPAADGGLTGTVHALRRRESGLFADLAATATQVGPSPGSRHVVVVGRPLLVRDLSRLAPDAGNELLLVVPVEGPTPDGVPATTLMRSVLHVAADLGRSVKVVATPLFWRDPESNEAVAQAVADHYDATTSELLVDGADWTDLLVSLRAGSALPQTATAPVLDELRRWRPVPAERGLVVLFTGLSGSGKSTVARDLAAHVAEWTTRSVSLLDGDDVRRLLSAGLGFDHAARDLNVRRIGYVGSEVARHGGLAICAPIAPYAESRAAVRAMVEPVGDFVLVHISTPLAECERRDLKGLYAKARAGLINEFTGISDPYEAPVDADLTIDTSTMTREAALERALDLLTAGGWIVREHDR